MLTKESRKMSISSSLLARLEGEGGAVAVWFHKTFGKKEIWYENSGKL